MKIKEEKLVHPVRRFLERRGYQTYTEIPAANRIMDVVGTRGNSVVGVEVKVEDWRTALCQALDYRSFCNYVYLAMWARKVHLADRRVCRRSRIGLLSVGPRNVRVVQPPIPMFSRRKLRSIPTEDTRERQSAISQWMAH